MLGDIRHTGNPPPELEELDELEELEELDELEELEELDALGASEAPEPPPPPPQATSRCDIRSRLAATVKTLVILVLQQISIYSV
ncbi:MAG: hypothetical protein IPO35_07740 [Uliginosibacterium sp.]|nr:hypothetical protein [Uliginosibacterium sp.]